MYTDILYTLSAPRAGRVVYGVSKSSNRLITTGRLSAAISLGKVKDTESFRCRTPGGEAYLVYLLPPELSPRHRFRYRHSHPPERTGDFETGYPQTGRSLQSEAVLRQLRQLLTWLALLSFLLSAQGTLGLQLWDLFVSLVKLFMQS